MKTELKGTGVRRRILDFGSWTLDLLAALRAFRQVNSHVTLLLLSATAAFTGVGTLSGAGLNTDVALTPPEGGTIVRAQWRYTELSSDPTPLDRKVRLNAFPITAVYGVTSDFAVLATVPLVRRTVEVGAQNATLRDTGFADIPVLGKYRFYQDDRPGRTTRWAVVGGTEVPTFDSTFSSESFNPIIGTVWTHQRLRGWVDWSVRYQFNTGGGQDGDDRLRADAAGSYPLYAGERQGFGPWGLYAIGEVNADYLTDGSTRTFLSPGIQFITARWIAEAGIQLPVHQEMKSPRLETDFTTVASFRFQF